MTSSAWAGRRQCGRQGDEEGERAGGASARRRGRACKRVSVRNMHRASVEGPLRGASGLSVRLSRMSRRSKLTHEVLPVADSTAANWAGICNGAQRRVARSALSAATPEQLIGRAVQHRRFGAERTVLVELHAHARHGRIRRRLQRDRRPPSTCAVCSLQNPDERVALARVKAAGPLPVGVPSEAVRLTSRPVAPDDCDGSLEARSFLMSPASNLSASLGLLLRLSFRVGLGFRLGPRLGFRFRLRFGKRLLPLGLRLGLGFSIGFRFGLSLRFAPAPRLSPAPRLQRAPWLPRPGLWPAPRRPRARSAWRGLRASAASGRRLGFWLRLALRLGRFRGLWSTRRLRSRLELSSPAAAAGIGGGAAASAGLSSTFGFGGALGRSGRVALRLAGIALLGLVGDAVGARLRRRLDLLGALLALGDLRRAGRR